MGRTPTGGAWCRRTTGRAKPNKQAYRAARRCSVDEWASPGLLGGANWNLTRYLPADPVGLGGDACLPGMCLADRLRGWFIGVTRAQPHEYA